MEEAGPSEPDLLAKDKGTEQDGRDKALSQNRNNPGGRQGSHNRNPRPKPRQVQAEKHDQGQACDTKPKSKSKPRGRQNARSQGKMVGETGLSSQTEGEELNTEGIGSSCNTSRQTSKEKSKSYQDYKSRPHSGRSQRFTNYSKLKPGLAENLGRGSKYGTADQLDVSAPLPSKPCSLMATDIPKPFTSHGIVSDGIYVPKNKLRSSGRDSRKKYVDDSPLINNQTDLQRNLHSSKRFDYSYCVGGPRKQPSFDVDKLAANFQAVSMKSQGQSSVQASVLIEQLSDEKYECMVCCEVVRCSKAVWSCSNCFHIFHLYCIKRWARSPAAAIEGERIFLIITINHFNPQASHAIIRLLPVHSGYQCTHDILRYRMIS